MRYQAMSSPDWAAEIKMAQAVDKTGVSKRIRRQLEELTSGLDDMCKDGDHKQAAEGLSDYIKALSDMDNKWQKNKVLQRLRESRIVNDIIGYCPPETRKIYYGGTDAQAK